MNPTEPGIRSRQVQRSSGVFREPRSFGLSQFHGHGSWLMCEVLSKVTPNTIFI